MVKTYPSVLIAVLVFLVSCGTPGQPETNNKITPKHVNTPGTKTSLIPPENFISSKGFSGFEQISSGSSIMVVEMPTPYTSLIAGITPAGLAASGVIERSREEFTFNSNEATLVDATQNAFGTIYEKTILIFGDNSDTIMITGVSPQSQINLKSEIKTSILSAVYEKDLEINKEDALGFSIDVSDSKFKFGEIMSLSAIYTVDGKVPTENEDASSLMVGKSFSKVRIDDPKEFAIKRLDELPSIMEGTPEMIIPIDINGMEGFEIISYQKHETTFEKELVYQVILYDNFEYYLVVGKAEADFEANLKEFQKIAQTFKRK